MALGKFIEFKSAQYYCIINDVRLRFKENNCMSCAVVFKIAINNFVSIHP